MKMYGELAPWWPLLSSPEDYAEEAEFFLSLFRSHGAAPQVLLELGSGGGNTASHLKAHTGLTLVDLSPQMLEVSSNLNPECRHIQGDMRTIRLGEQFDGVFVHDAVMYMSSDADLRATVRTAYDHCLPGGVAVFSPDCVRETFRPATDHGGTDDPERSLRFLEWCWDPDPADTSFIVDYVLVLREGQNEPRVVHERHENGLFERAQWRAFMEEAGFQVSVVPDRW
ncbi:MAG: class I SAM-dependent methyltransferase, partial [Rhodospirillaceae bacterium]